jgi:hypothetical protein
MKNRRVLVAYTVILLLSFVASAVMASPRPLSRNTPLSGPESSLYPTGRTGGGVPVALKGARGRAGDGFARLFAEKITEKILFEGSPFKYFQERKCRLFGLWNVRIGDELAAAPHADMVSLK